MDLLEKQFLMTRCLGKLLMFAATKGYEFTLADGHRPDSKGHMKGSLHYSRLAQDLNLFIVEPSGRPVWIKADHPAWHELGQYWKSLDPLCAWGGDFAIGDFNHFSIRHDGKE